MPTIELVLPRPHSAQQKIIDEAARFNVVDCGRRFGKTMLGIDRAVSPDVLSYPAGWFSPSYKMLLEVWRVATAVLRPITKRRNVQERRFEFVTGGTLEFWSLDKPDSARGRKYRRIIVDEAAMVPELLAAWNAVLRPTLVDYAGDAWFLSTPKGMNGFWQMYQWGLDDERPEWACWQMSTSANPFIPASEIEAMRGTMPERVFAQEVQATFLEDAGGVFRGVMAAATATEQSAAQPGHNYVIGVDWAQMVDFTVYTVIDTTTNEVVYLDRFNQIDYSLQVDRLMALYKRFRPVQIVAEQNSIGLPVITALQQRGLPVQPFQTTNASKHEAVKALQMAFESNDIQIIPDDVLIGELQAFEAERLPSGMLRYAAPEGMHDDCVMSLAIGWQAVANYMPAFL